MAGTDFLAAAFTGTVAAGFLLGVSVSCRRIVYVPAQVPAPPEIAKPHLPATDINPGMSCEQREKALWESLALVIGYSKAQEEILAGYRTTPPAEGKK